MLKAELDASTITGAQSPFTKPLSAWASADSAVEPSRYVKVECSRCSGPFPFDEEEHRSTPCEEMESMGRQFLGLRVDAILCPSCLQEVKLAGAERMYWRLASC
jgi:hypothetical protein